MPEGHTIRRAAREHRRLLVGEALRASSPQGRFAREAHELDGRVLADVEPYGKHDRRAHGLRVRAASRSGNERSSVEEADDESEEGPGRRAAGWLATDRARGA